MPRLILGTAGHIDHGKTALVRALTGVDTDRLPEEKRRGITIDLGFASLRLADDLEIDLIDVPGHEAFIRNMLAGATGIDLVLLVVAADEGVMPQTREHLAIVELLGIRRGVVAITKADLVDPEWLELVSDEVRELLSGSALADAPMQVVSARSGQGIAELAEVIRQAAHTVRSRSSIDLFRMPIDRVFTVRGTGTVVTGTVWSGGLLRDAQVRIEPAGLVARVRVLQRHGSDCDRIEAGERAAVALAGVDRQALTRGDTLLDSSDWAPSSILTVQVSVLADAAAPLRPRQRVRVHLGTAEVMARLALPDGEIAPGAQATAQLRLERPLLARALDRLVIRSYSPVRTIAGGIVLEPDAPRRKRFTDSTRSALCSITDPDRGLDALLDLAGANGIQRRLLPLVTGRGAAALDDVISRASHLRVIGERVVRADVVRSLRQAIEARVRRYHAERPLDEGMDRELLRREVDPDGGVAFNSALQELLMQGVLTGSGGAVAVAGHEPAPGEADRPLLERLAAVYSAAGVQAPDLQELPSELSSAPQLGSLVRLLERRGAIIRLGGDRWADADAVASAAFALRAQLVIGQEIAMADFKHVLNLSRKHLIPLLEYFDRTGVTRRSGEGRMLLEPAGPGESHGAPAGDAAAPPLGSNTTAGRVITDS
jgi:selenocysteine-specific elongation factor